ncbi:MAG: hypothetical protein Q4C43_01805 [Prevotella sp.]|jgi:hypothetical protein|nr:hypothetical protein [Prevotella sp.]MDO4934196.1 hypothetical protein [Prevotella sp.]
MNRILTILFPALLALTFFSCNEDEKEVSDVAIFIDPGASVPVTVSSGDKYLYHIDLYTTHDYVRQLTVSSFDQYQGKVIVKDTSWTERCDSYDFVYTAPVTDRDSLRVTLTFTVTDNAGSTGEVQRQVLIRNRQVLVPEKSGIVLWAPETGRPDALGFGDPSKTFNLSASGDSASADLYIEVDAAFENVKVKSGSAARFVRNNSFDYAAASATSVQAVFVGSRHDDVVDNLRVNDIILVGHGDRAEGVMRVMNIIRTGDEGERCVQIAFKGLK